MKSSLERLPNILNFRVRIYSRTEIMPNLFHFPCESQCYRRRTTCQTTADHIFQETDHRDQL